MAVRTDYKTPPANPHKHDHGLTQVDAALAGKAATTHTHPEIAALDARVTALEAAVKALTPVTPSIPPAPTGLKAVAAANTVALTWGVVA